MTKSTHPSSVDKGELLPVTVADRQLAAAIAGINGFAWTGQMYIDGSLDDDEIMRAIIEYRAALTPSALSGDAGEGEMPADLRRLVIAARTIAFNDWDGDSEEWVVARKELDDASEAFASRVPWENEP